MPEMLGFLEGLRSLILTCIFPQLIQHEKGTDLRVQMLITLQLHFFSKINKMPLFYSNLLPFAKQVTLVMRF